MATSIAYEKDCAKKDTEKLRNVKYDCLGPDQQCYTATEKNKCMEDRNCVKYACGGGGKRNAFVGATAGGGCESGAQPAKTVAARRRSSKCGSSSSNSRPPPVRARSCVTTAPKRERDSSSGEGAICDNQQLPEKRCDRVGYRKLTPTEVAAECYEVRRAQKKYQPCADVRWQHGKYVRDECGSGIVPVRFDIGPHKRLWCKTPLSMYQATIGELGRQLLCREKTIARDVWPEPPCNMSEYIMPPCRGYYRKYDCIRPCEEDHAYVQRGKKYYRDRVQRYWEPCLTQEQKHTLNINEYAPHNAALALKLRRETINIPCW